jgi:hypothetical protein
MNQTLGAKGGRSRGVCHLADGHTNKTRVKPDIPTKSYTCTSMSRLLGNVYTAKSCNGKKQVPDAFKIGNGQLGKTTPTENIGPPG